MDFYEKRASLIEKYGEDTAIFRLSMVALLGEFNIDPEHANDIRKAISEWQDSWDYLTYHTKSLEEKLLDIDDSDNMKSLCKRVSSYAYHMEEAACGLL